MPSSAGRESFLALPVVGSAGALPVHGGARLGPGRAPRRVLWASKVARAGSFSRRLRPSPPEPRRTMEAPQFRLFALLLLLYHTGPQALKLSTPWRPRYNSICTSSSSLRDGHGRCFCVSVCAMFPVILGHRNEHITPRCDSLYAGQGGGRHDPTPTRNFERYRAATVHTIWRKHSSGTTAPALQAPAFVTATVFSCFCICSQCSPGDANRDHIFTCK